jgi:xanthine dehydrogenase/oxidase
VAFACVCVCVCVSIGKETRTVIFSAPVAVAAHALGVPVRINVDRDVDMQLTGQRHAFVGKYTAGCRADGTLQFMEVELYSNAGFSYDLSEPVLGRALLHVDGVYRWPALKAVGRMCRTNQPSHTAFRGFGGPQGMVVVETIVEHLHRELTKQRAGIEALSITEFRLKNMYREGDETHFGTRLEQFNVPEACQQVISRAGLRERELKIKEFNVSNRWKKRGICVLPTKYGMKCLISCKTKCEPM